MNEKCHKSAMGSILDQEGKGLAGCIFILVLLGLLGFVGFKVGPDYFACREFEADLKTEASRAGANFFDDETIIKNVLTIARKNEIQMARENIKVERFGQQVRVSVLYVIPLDFYVYKTTMNCDVQASSYVGKL